MLGNFCKSHTKCFKLVCLVSSFSNRIPVHAVWWASGNGVGADVLLMSREWWQRLLIRDCIRFSFLWTEMSRIEKIPCVSTGRVGCRWSHHEFAQKQFTYARIIFSLSWTWYEYTREMYYNQRQDPNTFYTVNWIHLYFYSSRLSRLILDDHWKQET